MQKLTLPFYKCMMLCGYKNAQYLHHWGYAHDGIDISAYQAGHYNTYVISSGKGTVVAAGKDPALGYGIAILYPQCYNRITGETVDLIARYMHLAELYVKEGDVVLPGTKIAREGKEGTTDFHLHFELDTDINYPRYTPQVAQREGAFWIRGVDTTIDPSHFLHCSSKQELVEPTYNPAWLNPDDFTIPTIRDDEVEDSTVIGSMNGKPISSEATLAFMRDLIAVIDRHAETLKNLRNM